MGQHRNQGKATDPDGRTQAVNETASKKPYVAPVLVEYGTIAKLTQGSRTRYNDGGNTKKSKCL